MKYFFTLLLFCLISVGCSSGNGLKVNIDKESDTIHVAFFYGKHQCDDCKAIRRVASSVVDSLCNPKVVMHCVDINSNEELAREWDAAWTALKISCCGKIVDLTKEGYAMARPDSTKFKALIINNINTISQNGEHPAPTR